MLKAVIIRSKKGQKQMLGSFHLFENEKEIFNCITLEKPWQNNKQNISCIPNGSYYVTTTESPKYGETLQIVAVPNRSHILFHSGNYETDTKGCILLGGSFKDINHDNLTDIVNSRKTVNKLESITSEFLLTIIEI